MNEIQKPLVDHLHDLKTFLVSTAIVWAVSTIGMLVFWEQLFAFFIEPISSKGIDLNFVSPTDSITNVLKICTLAGFLLAMPFITYFLWNFIKPGLAEKEQKFISKYVLTSLLFSTLGVIFAYIFLIPTTLGYLIDFLPANTKLLLTANEYMNFLYGLLMIMILVFQTPVVVYGLIKSCIVPRKTFIHIRKFFYLGTVIFMALFGGQDLITLALTTLPVIAMYEGAILLARKPKISHEVKIFVE
jgi:sec-independent protein translocase protein TatC